MVEIKLRIKNAKIKENKEESYLQSVLKEDIVSKHILFVEKKAYDKGLAEGKEIGYKQKTGELLSLIKSLEDVLKNFGNVKNEIVKKFEPYVIDISLKAAEKIIGDELISGSAKLGGIIVSALENLPGATLVKIRLNPDDYSMFLMQKRELLTGKVFAGIEIIADETVSKGGSIIESDVGMIDATLETRIEELKKIVKGL